MRPSDLYAMQTIDEEGWTWSPALDVMFGDPDSGTWGSHGTHEDLPLGVATKVEAFDEGQGRGLVR